MNTIQVIGLFLVSASVGWLVSYIYTLFHSKYVECEIKKAYLEGHKNGKRYILRLLRYYGGGDAADRLESQMEREALGGREDPDRN